MTQIGVFLNKIVPLVGGGAAPTRPNKHLPLHPLSTRHITK